MDVEKWAARLGYSEERLEELNKKGLLKKILSNGWRGTMFQWYDKKTGWTRGKSKRVGVVAVKVGMRLEKDWWGQGHPVTVLQLMDNVVTQVKTEEKEGYYALQVGAGLRRLHKLPKKLTILTIPNNDVPQTTKPMMGHFAKAGVPPKVVTKEFHVTKDALLPLGTKIFAQHFKPGQFVDVRGTTRGKGFAGAMKRWGFGGGFASHGQSVTHRSLGSTGMNQCPGHVFKGKRMAGHMGVDTRTVLNLRILKIDTQDQMLYVMGCVPGPVGGHIEVSDARVKTFSRAPPFPTFFRKPGLVQSRYLYWRYPDPHAKIRQIDWDLKTAEAVASLRAAQAAGEAEEAGPAAASAEEAIFAQ